MSRKSNWTALFLAATFLVGGTVMPVLHRVEHALEWRDLAAAHAHPPVTSASVVEGCAALPLDHGDCVLCQRHLLSLLIPEPENSAQYRIETYVAASHQRDALPLVTVYQSRAPPLTA